MNYARILLFQRQEDLEEIPYTTLSNFEREVIVDELIHVETALFENEWRDNKWHNAYCRQVVIIKGHLCL